jgi:hypothetical protein
MKYECRHEKCDICGGGREHERPKTFGKLVACESCVEGAVRFAYEAACTWACGEIDTTKPCRHCREKAKAESSNLRQAVQP